MLGDETYMKKNSVIYSEQGVTRMQRGWRKKLWMDFDRDHDLATLAIKEEDDDEKANL